MALIYPAAALAGIWVLGGYAHDLKREASRKEEMEMMREDPPPIFGAIGHIKDYGLASDLRLFRSVREDRDVQGAKIFWVDYGNGQLVQQYFDPRLLL